MADDPQTPDVSDMNLVSHDDNTFTFKIGDDGKEFTRPKSAMPTTFELLMDKATNKEDAPDAAQPQPLTDAQMDPSQALSAGVPNDGGSAAPAPALAPAPTTLPPGVTQQNIDDANRYPSAQNAYLRGANPTAPAAAAPVATDAATDASLTHVAPQPAAAHGQMSPFRPMTSTMEGGSNTTANPTAQGAYGDLSSAAGGVANAEVKAEQKTAALNAAAAVARQKVSEGFAKQAADAQQRLQDETTRQMDEYAKLIESRQGMKLDSTRMFGDGQTGNKIWAALALGLGAMGQAFSGKDYNTGIMGMINTAIDRDIDMQKNNMMTADKNIANKRGMLEDSLKVANDMRSATEATRVAQLNFVQDKLDEIKNSPANSNPLIKANVAKLDTDVKGTLAKTAQGLGSSVNNNSTTTQQTLLPEVEPARRSDYEALGKKRVALDRLEQLLPLYAPEEGLAPNALHERMVAAKKMLGMQNATDSQVQTQLKALTTEVVLDAGGTRGLSPGAFPNLSGLSVDMTQKNPVILSQIKQLRAQYERESYQMAHTDMVGHRPPDPDQIYHDLGGGAPITPQTTQTYQGKKFHKIGK